MSGKIHLGHVAAALQAAANPDDGKPVEQKVTATGGYAWALAQAKARESGASVTPIPATPQTPSV